MSHSLVLEGSRKQLVSQLVYFDEERLHFLDQYFPEHNQQRNRAERVINVYVSTLENLLSDLNQERIHSLALIGSKLQIVYLDDLETESFTIVFPHLADPGQNKISFLAPIGFQLLMAVPGETYRLQLPTGEVSVKVESIRYMNSGYIE